MVWAKEGSALAGDRAGSHVGTGCWLVVPEAPEKVWPMIREFWQNAGHGIDQNISDKYVLMRDKEEIHE